MVTIDQVEKGIATYLDKELMPLFKDESPLQKIIIGTSIGLILRKSKGQIALLKENPVVKMTGVFNEQGDVDIDILKEEVVKNIPEEGFKVDVPAIGALTFRKGDVDKLYECITNTSTLQ